ncbi:MAG: hypothetical protein K8R87_12795 [Verrucomicrobia bacterium]|nr:hypothetical protein [Verrucomicrobiota bacterium]
MPRPLPLLLLCLSVFLASCADPMVQQRIDERRISIQNEPRGDYYIGRRFYIERTQFWGYIRRPGQSWDDSKLVIFNENRKNAPDRLPEMPTGDGMAHGFDNNREYKISGYYTGRKVYDPNSDLFLPEFMLTNWEVRNESPGWLFHPKEKIDGQHLLRFEKAN